MTRLATRSGGRRRKSAKDEIARGAAGFRVTQGVGEAAGHRDMRVLGHSQPVEAALFQRYREFRRSPSNNR